MDWLQFSLAMMMAFVGLESIASGFRFDMRERSWLSSLALVWFVVAAVIALKRLFEF